MSQTPAEKLAKRKSRARGPRNAKPPRNRVFAPKLRELREQLNLSIRDVAEAVGLSLSSYWEIEQGGDVCLTNALAIAKFFGVTVEAVWQSP
jgi:DNA-binding XRE family transcriptional regulator